MDSWYHLYSLHKLLFIAFTVRVMYRLIRYSSCTCLLCHLLFVLSQERSTSPTRRDERSMSPARVGETSRIRRSSPGYISDHEVHKIEEKE